MQTFMSFIWHNFFTILPFQYVIHFKCVTQSKIKTQAYKHINFLSFEMLLQCLTLSPVSPADPLGPGSPMSPCGWKTGQDL